MKDTGRLMTDTHQLLMAIDPVILLLSLGMVAVVVTRHIGLSPIVGYLAIGLALRSAGQTVFENSTTIEVLSELGVVFLLFDIGLHFSFTRIREQAANIFGFGPLQILLGMVIIGVGAHFFSAYRRLRRFWLAPRSLSPPPLWSTV
jgi:Kef-type K+ transport system membrane component KefB